MTAPATIFYKKFYPGRRDTSLFQRIRERATDLLWVIIQRAENPDEKPTGRNSVDQPKDAKEIVEKFGSGKIIEADYAELQVKLARKRTIKRLS